MFLAFSPQHMCSDLIHQIKSLLSLNWQVSKVLIVKFQASTLDQCHRLLINLSCISASKPLNAQYCTWARSHRGHHYDCALYLHASDVHQHSTFNRNRAAALLLGRAGAKNCGAQLEYWSRGPHYLQKLRLLNPLVDNALAVFLF